MLITTWTKAAGLMPYMGTEATIDEAKFMLDILLQSGYGNTETSKIPEDDWLEMCKTAVRFAYENPGHWDERQSRRSHGCQIVSEAYKNNGHWS